jgi:hypothetical protein
MTPLGDFDLWWKKLLWRLGCCGSVDNKELVRGLNFGLLNLRFIASYLERVARVGSISVILGYLRIALGIKCIRIVDSK